MRAWVGWLILIVGAPAWAVPVYRHIDAQGNVVYSDEAKLGERVDLKPVTVIDAERSDGASPTPAMPSGVVTPQSEYSRFAIVSPNDEQTIPTGQAGNVQVQLAIEPALRQGDRVQLRVDGNLRQSPMHTRVFALTQLERGEHRLQAELVDAQGTVLLATPAVTLYVQRASVNLPRNPNNPNQ